jgi:ActR/RegA family two-component response regulator
MGFVGTIVGVISVGIGGNWVLTDEEIGGELGLQALINKLRARTINKNLVIITGLSNIS